MCWKLEGYIRKELRVDLTPLLTPLWQIAHRMFYDACLCGGVSKIKAKVMYWAVRTFGPKWGDQKAENVLTRKQFIELQKIDEFIKSKNINQNSSYDEIEKLMSD